MEAPSFGDTCPTSRSVVAEKGSTSAVVNWAQVKVTDNDLANLTVFPAVTPPHIFSEGDRTVVYTAKDPSGNIKQCSFKITVQGKKKKNLFQVNLYTRDLSKIDSINLKVLPKI